MEVIIKGGRSTPDARERAQFAPINEIPALSPEQEEVAARYVGSREQYARSLYAEELSTEELGRKVVRIGRLVEKLAKEHLPDVTLYRGMLVTYSGLLRLFLKMAGQEVEIDVEEDLVDQLMRTGSKELMERLRLIVQLSIPSVEGESLAS